MCDIFNNWVEDSQVQGDNIIVVCVYCWECIYVGVCYIVSGSVYCEIVIIIYFFIECCKYGWDDVKVQGDGIVVIICCG